jgi:4-amino-4-deoxychorismate lyase
MKELIFLNGEPMKGEFPLRSLLYAEGVFETFRWKGSPPAFLGAHLERMKRGAQFLDLPFPKEAAIRDAVRGAVTASGIDDAYVRLNLLSSGPAKFPKRADHSHLLLVIREYEPPEEHVRAHLSRFRRLSSSPLHGIKSLNYLENVIARREAEDLGYDEAIFLNERGEVAEGSATNLFWVKENELFTPARECGLLPGITRKVLISLAPELGLEVREGRFGLGEIFSARGVFLTSSLRGLAALVAIDGRKIPFDEDLYARMKIALYRKLKWA